MANINCGLTCANRALCTVLASSLADMTGYFSVAKRTSPSSYIYAFNGSKLKTTT